jgi:hypothetical protein
VFKEYEKVAHSEREFRIKESEILGADFGFGFDGFLPGALGGGEEDLFEIWFAGGEAV